MLILNFTYPIRCRRVPLGVRVPPVEYHWSRRSHQRVARHSTDRTGQDSRVFVIYHSPSV
jgi:hypothetical protein